MAEKIILTEEGKLELEKRLEFLKTVKRPGSLDVRASFLRFDIIFIKELFPTLLLPHMATSGLSNVIKPLLSAADFKNLASLIIIQSSLFCVILFY